MNPWMKDANNTLERPHGFTAPSLLRPSQVAVVGRTCPIFSPKYAPDRTCVFTRLFDLIHRTIFL